MNNSGQVVTEIRNSVASITFHHPKGNSLPGIQLKRLADSFDQIARYPAIRVIILQSEGDGAFCAGASFDELLEINDFSRGKEFFLGFAQVILAMKNCPKFIIARIQGKAVGGGVGLIAASDYVIALNTAFVKLSELDLGIGPFVVGPAIERKIGKGAFSALSIDTSWRNSEWSQIHGLFSDVVNTIEELNSKVSELSAKLSQSSLEAISQLKSVLWENTENWNDLLTKRAEISGRLVLSDFTRNFIASFRKQESK